MSNNNIVERLDGIPAAQGGYLTRAQASDCGVEDLELHRAARKGFINRVAHGVYRVAGAPSDRLQELRIAWLRLQPAATPRERVVRPRIWVSHESAANVHGYGVFLSDVPTFISSQRLQSSKKVKIYRRSKGLSRSEWTIIDGFAVTGVDRTAADLFAKGVDGGHLGRFMNDAIAAGSSDPERMRLAMGATVDDFAALIEMSAPVEGGSIV